MLQAHIGSVTPSISIALPETDMRRLVQCIKLLLSVLVAGLCSWGVLNLQATPIPAIQNPVVVHAPRIIPPATAVAQHNPRFQRLGAYVAERFDVEPEDALDIVAAVFRNAEQVNVSPHLVLGMIAVESGFNPEASYLGAKGLMQIIPTYHHALMREINHDLFDPERNIYAGTRILAKFREISPSLNVAILRYNGSLGDPNQTYLRKVMAETKKFEAAEQRSMLGQNESAPATSI